MQFNNIKERSRQFATPKYNILLNEHIVTIHSFDTFCVQPLLNDISDRFVCTRKTENYSDETRQTQTTPRNTRGLW